MRNWLICIIHALFVCLITETRAESIRGVNLGGWLLVEEWITPSLFRSTGTEDEWSLCNELGKDKCLQMLEEHWSSFITRDDFEDMRSAGLNALRIPIGYWAIDLQDDEPYVAGQYPYLIQAVQWASELGFQVMIDLHGAPGSQNGQDNSGLIGPVLFPSNSSNADRSLNVLRNLTEEFSQDIYAGAVTAIELLNEPRLDDDDFPMSQLKDFYADGAELVSSGSSNAISVAIHDAFWGPTYWSTYSPFPNTSSQPQPNLILDTHQYYAFPPHANLSRPAILSRICNISQTLKLPTTPSHQIIVGEFSLETNSSPDSASESQSHHAGPSQAQRTWYRLLFEAQVAAYGPSQRGSSAADDEPIQGWYFWTWKTEWEIDTWSYRRGWRDGWIPSDVGNRSTFAFPLLESGCVDVDFGWEAPAKVGGAAAMRWGGMQTLWWVGVFWAVVGGMVLIL